MHCTFVLYDDETNSLCKDSYSTNNLCSGWRQERAHLKMIKLTLICHLKGCISAINPQFVCLHPISTVIIINVVVVIIIVTFVIIISSISSNTIIANTDFLLWTFQVWSQEPFYGKHQSENILIFNHLHTLTYYTYEKCTSVKNLHDIRAPVWKTVKKHEY